MQGELTADSFAAFTSISLLAVVFVAGVGRIAGAVVAGIMFSAAGLFVTFLNIHLNVGKYQAIVAGVALVLTAVQNPDGLTSTSTGKGPAVGWPSSATAPPGSTPNGSGGRRRLTERRCARHQGRHKRHSSSGCLRVALGGASAVMDDTRSRGAAGLCRHVPGPGLKMSGPTSPAGTP